VERLPIEAIGDSLIAYQRYNEPVIELYNTRLELVNRIIIDGIRWNKIDLPIPSEQLPAYELTSYFEDFFDPAITNSTGFYSEDNILFATWHTNDTVHITRIVFGSEPDIQLIEHSIKGTYWLDDDGIIYRPTPTAEAEMLEFHVLSWKEIGF
jgi:hypothetical protein